MASRKNKVPALFEPAFLHTLIEDESSCVKIQDQNYHLALHPFHLNNIGESLKDILNQGIGKYDKKLDGILLGYKNIKLLSQSGAVANDSFFIHLDIAASFYLFKPEIGKILTGTVNKKSRDHVACLVHKTFNVSLPKPETVDDDADWMGAKVGVGQDILFRIIFVNLEARLPYIKAEFVAILGEQDSGISTSEENVVEKENTKIVFQNNSEDEEIIPKKKKKKHKKETTENVDAVKEKKKKKRKREEENEDAVTENKQKHKSKYNQQEHVESVDQKRKKKSKHIDISGIAELELDETHDYKKRKSKHKDQSYEEPLVENTAIEYDSYSNQNVEELDEIQHYKQKKDKHKNQSYEEETHRKKSIQYNGHENEEEFDGEPHNHKGQEEPPNPIEYDGYLNKNNILDEIHDYKKKKRKHKDRSYEEESIRKESIEYDTYLNKNEETEVIPNLTSKDEYDNEDLTKLKKKTKKSKHKRDLEEDITIAEHTSKKKKKIKQSDSLEDLTHAVLQRTLLSVSANQTKEDQKSSPKKKPKHKNLDHSNISDDLSFLEPDLNLSKLLSHSSKSSTFDNFQMADGEDKISKKRRKSTSHTGLWDGKIELTADSDLEQILKGTDKVSKQKHKKEGCDENLTKLTKKRRRSTSSDDFQTPVPRKKYKLV